MTVIYAARWVLPISSSMIQDGAIAVDDSTIVAVGSGLEIVSRFPGAQIKDFGQAAILPGFVNAHSHLELTVMRGFLEREENDFPAWLRKLTVARMAMTTEDLLVSATCGAAEAARAGVTFLGDASSMATQAIKALQGVGLRGIVYQESFGPDPQLAHENVRQLREQISELLAFQNELVSVGISPHSPYTVSGPQLDLLARLAMDEKLPLMMHAAESRAEQSLMLEGSGRFAEGLRARGIEWQTPGLSTVQYLERHGILATKPLLAHCVHVDERDLELIQQAGAGIAHCPKSNAKLGHGRAPFSTFVTRGLKVGLGSDSVASNNSCDILEEARFATLFARLEASERPVANESKGVPQAIAPVNAADALFAATLGGARALGRDDQTGSLAAGMQADIAVIGLNGAHQHPAENPAAALVFSSSGRDVLLTLVAGKEIYRDGRVSNVDEAELQSRLETIRIKLDSVT